MHMKRTDYDIWDCPRCGTWKVQAIPHQPHCPICQHGGWWLGFDQGPEYDTEDSGLLRKPEAAS
jgi:hypothetical protein